MFYGYDGDRCGGEQLALQYYADEGGGWLARCSTTATVGRPLRWRLAVQIDRPVRPSERDMILIRRPDQSRHTAGQQRRPLFGLRIYIAKEEKRRKQ